MAAYLRDLIHFEEVEEVIKIRKEEKAKEYVEKYVISDSLQRNLLYMLQVLSGATHKSFNIVGNYGTGKSHFLAFVAALLEHPEFHDLIRDEDVREAAQDLDRRYLVVKFELGAVQEVSLRYIFFDQIRKQLLDRYDIEVREIDLATDYDNKQNILNILSDIKAKDPEAGLVVIVDEISDFMKQKDKTGMAHDIALLRELGEISQDSDFLYIGAMQEHVFTDPKYIDQAENIARVSQRFVIITITKEDVAQVLKNRVVVKDTDQRQQLMAILDEHRQYFPNLAHDIETYVDLFPIHPFVIDIFERLPYFENRGIIGFTVQNVKPLMDEEAPRFVTYDRVYDLINITHEIRNLPTVSEVIDAVDILLSKAGLLDKSYREDAYKLIKALAVLKLLGGEKDLGATSQELANTLFITPPRRLLVEPSMAHGHIERVMKNLREVTVGRFIRYEEGRYTLDLSVIVDYEALIERKAKAAVIGHDDEIEKAYRDFTCIELGFNGQSSLIAGKEVFTDTSPWLSRKAFRPGLMITGKSEDGANLIHGDYRFVLQGPIPGKKQDLQNEVLLAVDFSDEMIALLIRARATQMLAEEKIYPKVMIQFHKKALDDFNDLYLGQLIDHGYTLLSGHKTELKKIPTKRALNTLIDIVDQVKGEMLDETFQEKYPNYPIFRTLITAANLESEVARTLQSLDRLATQQMDFNSRGYLESFGAIQDDQFSASTSPACQLILERIEENDKSGKMTPVDDLVREFDQNPWGLPMEMVYLLLGSLLFNGYVIFVQQGGKRLNAGEVSTLLKSGLDFFNKIRYVERDKDIDVEAVVKIFNILGLQSGLVRNKDTRAEAVKELRLRGGDLKTQLSSLRQAMNEVVADAGKYSGIPWLAIQEIYGKLEWLNEPLKTFSEVSRVSDLGKLDTSEEFRASLKARLNDLDTLDSFIKDWQEGLGQSLQRMQNTQEIFNSLDPLANVKEKSMIADLKRIAEDSHKIYTDESQFLRTDMRRPLKGKLEQYKQKYDQLYYNLHRRIVGDEAPWEELQEIYRGKRYLTLNQLKGLPFISPAEFNTLALEIQTLERRKCMEFNSEVLETFLICPYCQFPEDGTVLANITERTEGFQEKLNSLWKIWGTQIFNEIPGQSDRMALLSPAHQKQIESLIEAGKLPDELSRDTLDALFELFSDLQAVELDLNDLAQSLLNHGNALTVDEFQNGIVDYISDRMHGHDRDLVRIKIISKDLTI
ncbi:DUF6079 family protein [Chloroflexota bacterium]